MLGVMGRATLASFAAVAFVVALISLLLAGRGAIEHQSFKAFYCAGVAVRHREDPYRVEPLRSCERRLLSNHEPEGYVEPAPLPGYALAVFAPLALLSPKAAAVVFALAMAIATVLAAYCLSAVLQAPPAAVLLAFAPLALLNIAYGEIVPLAGAGICCAGYCIARERWVEAGAAVCVALIAPNVGVAAVVAVFLFAPRTRIVILIFGALLAILSVLALGVHKNIEYATTVLPLMARAELVASDQYSLSHLLYAAGMAPNLALLLGRMWFLIATIGSIAIAGVVSVRCRETALVPLIAPLGALFFGIYLHDIQMLLAIPAALAAAARTRGLAFRTTALAALALLVAVWTQRAARAALILDGAGVAGAVYGALSPAGNRLARAIAAAAVTLAAVLLLGRYLEPLAGSQIITAPFHVAPNDWAANAWAIYLRSTPALTNSNAGVKVPTLLGLFLTLVCIVRLGLTPSRSELREPPPESAPYSVSLQRYG